MEKVAEDCKNRVSEIEKKHLLLKANAMLIVLLSEKFSI